MTTTDELADEPAIEGENTGEDEGPPHGRLDPETASKCGLWLD